MTVDHTQLTGPFPKICSGAAPGYTFSSTSFIGLTNLRLLAVDNTNINCYPKCFYKTFSSAGLWAMTEQALTAGYGIYMDPGIPVCPREPINVFISSVYTNHWCSLSSYGHALRDPPSDVRHELIQDRRGLRIAVSRLAETRIRLHVTPVK